MKLMRIMGAITFIISSSLYCQTSPTYRPRSQGQNTVREIIGLTAQMNYRTDSWYTFFAPLIEYVHSYKARDIGQALFGTDFQIPNNQDAGLINIEGQSYHLGSLPKRTPTAWLADYFYLPSDFMSTIVMEPTITNVIINFDWYFGLDKLLRGAYFRILAPLTHTHWSLEFAERIVTRGSLAYPAGYFTAESMPLDTLLGSFQSYAAGNIPQAPAGDPTIFQPLKFGKIFHCGQTRWGMADLHVELGAPLMQDTYYRLGVNLQFSIPTGNKIEACYAFDPIIGNGQHLGIGAGVYGQGIWWHNEDDTKQWSVNTFCQFLHIFSAHEQRTFDLKCKPNSRYMLAQKMGTPVVDLTTASGIPSAQFQKEFAPVANLTTLDVDVSVNLEMDLSLWLNYWSHGFSFDFGYNYWSRGCEKFRTSSCESSCTQRCSTLLDKNQQNTWALKGDAHVFGFGSLGEAVALSATEHKSTIQGGTSGNLLDGTIQDSNTGVDSATIALFPPATPLTVLPLDIIEINTSATPLFIGADDILLEGMRGVSQTIFTHCAYTWNFNHWSPFLGIGGSIELGKNNGVCNTSCDTSCAPSCITASLSAWELHIKCGSAFE